MPVWQRRHLPLTRLRRHNKRERKKEPIMKDYAYPKNLHLIKATFHGPTNYRGSRVSIESCRFNDSEGPKDNVTIEFNSLLHSTIDNANAWLRSHGFDIVGVGELDNKSYVFISSTFKSIKQAETENEKATQSK